MNTPSNNDGWQTVGTRGWGAKATASGGGGGWGSRPAASGGGGGGAFRGWKRDEGESAGAFSSAFGRREVDPRREERRAAAEAQAAREAAEALEKKKAADAAAKKLADATNFASEVSYPSLGGGAPRPPPGSAKPALNFSKTVADMAEREAQREEEERIAAAAAEAARARARAAASYPTARYRGPPPRSTMYDEEADAYGEEEEDDAFEPEYQQMAYAGDDEEAEEDGEFNADIHNTRRRGDKGIW